MIKINVEKAKAIGHDIRRSEREKEFSPLDKQATIPMYAEQAEVQRQVVRDKYAEIQAQIDSAQTPEEIKQALGL